MNDCLVRMSEEEKREANEQLQLLEQASSELSQMSDNQTRAAEQVRRVNSFCRN